MQIAKLGTGLKSGSNSEENVQVITDYDSDDSIQGMGVDELNQINNDAETSMINEINKRRQ